MRRDGGWWWWWKVSWSPVWTLREKQPWASLEKSVSNACKRSEMQRLEKWIQMERFLHIVLRIFIFFMCRKDQLKRRKWADMPRVVWRWLLLCGFLSETGQPYNVLYFSIFFSSLYYTLMPEYLPILKYDKSIKSRKKQIPMNTFNLIFSHGINIMASFKYMQLKILEFNHFTLSRSRNQKK